MKAHLDSICRNSKTKCIQVSGIRALSNGGTGRKADFRMFASWACTMMTCEIRKILRDFVMKLYCIILRHVAGGKDGATLRLKTHPRSRHQLLFAIDPTGL